MVSIPTASIPLGSDGQVSPSRDKSVRQVSPSRDKSVRQVSPSQVSPASQSESRSRQVSPASQSESRPLRFRSAVSARTDVPLQARSSLETWRGGEAYPTSKAFLCDLACLSWIFFAGISRNLPHAWSARTHGPSGTGRARRRATASPRGQSAPLALASEPPPPPPPPTPSLPKPLCLEGGRGGWWGQGEAASYRIPCADWHRPPP